MNFIFACFLFSRPSGKRNFLLKPLDISLKMLYNYNSQLIKLKIFKLIIDKNF